MAYMTAKQARRDIIRVGERMKRERDKAAEKARKQAEREAKKAAKEAEKREPKVKAQLTNVFQVSDDFVAAFDAGKIRWTEDGALETVGA